MRGGEGGTALVHCPGLIYRPLIAKSFVHIYWQSEVPPLGTQSRGGGRKYVTKNQGF